MAYTPLDYITYGKLQQLGQQYTGQQALQLGRQQAQMDMQLANIQANMNWTNYYHSLIKESILPKTRECSYCKRKKDKEGDCVGCGAPN